MGDPRLMMTDEEVLKIVGDEDSGESDLTDAMPTIMRMVVRDMVNKRSSRKKWYWLAPLISAILASGGFGTAALLPSEAPALAPVSDKGDKTRKQIKELKRLSDEGLARDLQLEGILVDSLEWIGNGVKRKRGQAMDGPPDSLKEAHDRVEARRAEEARILADQLEYADIWR
jgi:hypothetical protein